MSKWKIALLGSIIINLLLFAAQSEVMKFGVPGGTGTDESVEVTLVQDEVAEPLPTIEKPKPQPVEPQPEEQSSMDASSMIPNDGVPVSDDSVEDTKKESENNQKNDSNKQNQATVTQGNPPPGDPSGKKSNEQAHENKGPVRSEAIELAGNQHELNVSVPSGTELPSAVTARYIVSVDGIPESIQIESTGDSDIDEKIYALVSSWRFSPALDADGEPMIDTAGIGYVRL